MGCIQYYVLYYKEIIYLVDCVVVSVFNNNMSDAAVKLYLFAFRREVVKRDRHYIVGVHTLRTRRSKM